MLDAEAFIHEVLVASLGVRPTIGDGFMPVVEVNLLDFDGGLYRAHLSVEFCAKLRDRWVSKYGVFPGASCSASGRGPSLRDLYAVRRCFATVLTSPCVACSHLQSRETKRRWTSPISH